MKRQILFIVCTFMTAVGVAEPVYVASPDGKTVVEIGVNDGTPYYSVKYDGTDVVLKSRLGVTANVGSFSEGMAADFVDVKTSTERVSYTMDNAKKHEVNKEVNMATVTFSNENGKLMSVIFAAEDNNIAFRYHFPLKDKKERPTCMVVESEQTGFLLPEGTTTFISPQIYAMGGWERTKPSYEEVYSQDAPMDTASAFGQGYTFPCLFHVPTQKDIWVLISETGVNGSYVGSHLSDYSPETGYTIAFPQQGENNGNGTATAGMALPGSTPWRTITVGDLADIVETTITYDVVEAQYSSETMGGGRYTWSWIVWQDNSINYDDQVAFIDVAAEMGYEYCLVDCRWDTEIGYDRMAELSNYAQSKGVRLLLWYNSNGYANDAYYTPKHKMNTALARQKEMAWLKEIGVAGIKVDFFGGDKQVTMQLYEDILADANEFGLMVVFHGCTLPRGWEKMYPNYISSEAVLASENVYFTEEAAIREARDLTLHPFCRNAIASMDWGGTIMNKYLHRDNKSRHRRHTTNTFEMAAAIVCQSALQCIAMQPNNLTDLTDIELDFLRSVPTVWDDIKFIDGYPGHYIVLARKAEDKWYIAAMNAEAEAKALELDLSMIPAGSEVSIYTDTEAEKEIDATTTLTMKKTDKKGKLKITIQPNGGAIIVQ